MKARLKARLKARSALRRGEKRLLLCVTPDLSYDCMREGEQEGEDKKVLWKDKIR